MRKFIVIGMSVVMAMAVIVGAIFAQDDTTATEEATTTRAWLGIAVAENDDQVVIVRVQSGSPADAADLLVGDAIVSFNDTAISSASDLSEQVQAAAPGDSAALEILRNGETLSVDVTLGTAPAGPGRGNRPGMELDAISIAEHLLNADLEEGDDGFEVVDILANRNPFELVAGDIVTSVNGQAVSELNLETLATDLRAMETPELSVVVVRDGAEVTLNSEAFFGGRGFGPGFGNRDHNGDNGNRGRGPGMNGPNNPPPAQDAAPSTDPAGDV